MEKKIQASYLRCSARKVRLVADLVRGRQAQRAAQELGLLSKRSARIFNKVLRNAISSVTQSGNVDASNLYIKAVIVGQGPSMKRWIPRARGSASPIAKKTCHIELVLEER